MTVSALNRSRHARVCIAPPPDLTYAGKQSHAVLGLTEVSLAAADYPLVLLKDGHTGRFHLAALLGLNEGSNLYVLNAKWHATYIPLTVLRYPFFLEEGALLGLAIDETSALVGNSGERLFDDQGEPTPYAMVASDRIGQMNRDRTAMAAFVDDIVGRQLVRPLPVTLIYEDGASTRVDGLYGIDSFALEALDGESLAQLNRRGHLGPVYVMMASLAQLIRLEQLHNARGERQLSRIDFGGPQIAAFAD